MSQANDKADNGCLSVFTSCFKPNEPAPPGRESPSIPARPVSENRSTSLSPPSAVEGPTTASASRLTENRSHNSLYRVSCPDNCASPSPNVLHTSNLWQRGLDQANDETKKWIDEVAKQSEQLDLIEVTDIVTSRTKEYEQTSKLKVGGREIIWRDYASRVVGIVTSIGDIATQFAPAPTPVVWSAIKVLLKAHVTQWEAIAASLNCTDTVLSLVRRAMVYQRVYLHESSAEQGQRVQEHLRELETTIVALYTTSLEVLAETNMRVKGGQMKQFLHALVDGGESNALLTELSQRGKDLDFMAQACGSIAQKRHEDLLQVLEEPLRRIDRTVQNMHDGIEDDQIRELLDYFSSIPHGRDHGEKTKYRTQGTCEWLLRTSQFRDWEDSSCSSILWLRGDIIDRATKDLKDEGCAFFYCNISDMSRRKSEEIFQSYMTQLARVLDDDRKMYKPFYDLFRKARDSKSGINLQECRKHLIEYADGHPRTTFILDALDECEQAERTQIIKTFLSIVQNSNSLVKVFISSRPELDLKKHLGSQNLITIGSSKNKHDIERFIRERISEVDDSWPISPETKSKAGETICDKSNGMFRWAQLQWEQIRDLNRDEDVMERLQRLPRTLIEAYDEIYERIGDETQERAMLQSAVMWIKCSREPLTTKILSVIITLDIRESSNGDRTLGFMDPTTQDQMERILNGFIYSEKTGHYGDSHNKWRFTHASVADYFDKRHRDWAGKVEELVIESILLFLIWYCSNNAPSTREPQIPSAHNSGQDVPFHSRAGLGQYVRQYWGDHAKKLSREKQSAARALQTLKIFLGSTCKRAESSKQYQRYCQSFHAVNRQLRYKYDSGSYLEDDIKPHTNAIFGVCAFGLTQVLEDWCDEGLDVSQINDRGLDLLTIAAKHCQVDTCVVLIEKGADPHRLLRKGETSALLEAIRDGRQNSFKYLISQNSYPRTKQRPSCAACLYHRDKGWLTAMLEMGVEPNEQCDPSCKYGCPLVAACGEDDTSLVQFLPQNNANVNISTNDWFGSPLAAASTSGPYVATLINYGADVNAQLEHGYYGSALAAAVSWGGEERVKILIDHGADINAQLKHGLYGNALAAAAFRSATPDTESIKFCIKQGAKVDTNLEHGIFGSSLAAAMLSGRPERLRLLIEHGAQIDTMLEHGIFGSSLVAAALGGSPECVDICIHHGLGADATFENGLFGSALAASMYGFGSGMEMLKHLLHVLKVSTSILLSNPPKTRAIYDTLSVLVRYSSDARMHPKRIEYAVRGGFISQETGDRLALEAKEDDEGDIVTSHIIRIPSAQWPYAATFLQSDLSDI